MLIFKPLNKNPAEGFGFKAWGCRAMAGLAGLFGLGNGGRRVESLKLRARG